MGASRVYLLLAFSALFQTSTSTPPEGYTYYPDASGWLKVHKAPASWTQARLKCRLEGGHVMSPESDAAKNTMLTAMDGANITEMFTGFIFHNGKEQYRSESDLSEHLPSHPWFPTSRKNPPGNEVLLLTSGKVYVPVSWKREYPYICIIRGEKTCGDKSGYYLHRKTNTCYKVYSELTTWNGGLTWCIEDGGSLAVINSREEAFVIRQLLAKSRKLSERAWVGVGLWVDNVYRAVDGTSLEDTGYDKFMIDEPSNNPDEFCLSVDFNVLLYDDKCMDKKVFICEKEASDNNIKYLNS